MRGALKDLRFNNSEARNRHPHAGLLLDRYFPIGEQNKDDQKSLYQTLERFTFEDGNPFLAKWKQGLEEFPDTEMREANTKGRLVIGLGAESVSEVGLTLHHTYGFPYLPGSALKGLAASYARKHLEGWDISSEAYQTLFGSTDEKTPAAGCVVFHDALPISARLHSDIITVHHPKYYQGEKDAPPADWDSPIPVSFLAVTGSFRIALTGPEAWRRAAFEILTLALAEEGLGGKTSSGYGKIKVESFKITAQKDDLIEAVVTSVNNNKVTYQLLGSEQRLTVKEPKFASLLAQGQIVTVKVDALKEDGAIKSVKLAK